MLKSLLITDDIPKLAEYFIANKQIDHSLILVENRVYYRFDKGYEVKGALGLDSQDENMAIYMERLSGPLLTEFYTSNIETYLASTEKEKAKFFYRRWLESNPNDSYLFDFPTSFQNVKSKYRITREQVLDLENNKFK
jgi:hypothetical protein